MAELPISCYNLLWAVVVSQTTRFDEEAARIDAGVDEARRMMFQMSWLRTAARLHSHKGYSETEHRLRQRLLTQDLADFLAMLREP